MCYSFRALRDCQPNSQAGLPLSVPALALLWPFKSFRHSRRPSFFAFPHFRECEPPGPASIFASNSCREPREGASLADHAIPVVAAPRVREPGSGKSYFGASRCSLCFAGAAFGPCRDGHEQLRSRPNHEQTSTAAMLETRHGCPPRGARARRRSNDVAIALVRATEVCQARIASGRARRFTSSRVSDMQDNEGKKRKKYSRTPKSSRVQKKQGRRQATKQL